MDGDSNRVSKSGGESEARGGGTKVIDERSQAFPLSSTSAAESGERETFIGSEPFNHCAIWYKKSSVAEN